MTALTERALRPVRPRMQPLSQDPYGPLSPHRIRGMVTEPLKVQGRWTADGPTRVAELLDRVGLDTPEGAIQGRHRFVERPAC